MSKHQHTKPCPECQGSGTQTFERAHRHSASRDVGFIEEYEDDCSNCGGDGQVEWDDEDYAEYEAERGDWLMHKRQDEERDRD